MKIISHTPVSNPVRASSVDTALNVAGSRDFAERSGSDEGRSERSGGSKRRNGGELHGGTRKGRVQKTRD